jgi:hypothetical protein
MMQSTDLGNRYNLACTRGLDRSFVWRVLFETQMRAAPVIIIAERSLLLQEYQKDGGISLRRFYLRRCFRILPPYYAVIAAVDVLSLLGTIRLSYSNLPSCVFFYRNYHPLGMDEQGGFYTAHFWTLAIEEHFLSIAIFFPTG